jgi:dTDP-4-amino-4,6-dideoxygalactose transaminase
MGRKMIQKTGSTSFVHEQPKSIHDIPSTITMFWPYISEKVAPAIVETLKTRWIGQGPKVEAAELKFSEMFNIPYALTVNSCTSALHLALILAGVDDGDEVVTTPMTCAATNTPILYRKAKVIFADIQPNTLNIDPKDIEKRITQKTKAIIAVHWGGYPCDMDEIMTIAKRHRIAVVEDAAHALGASYKDKDIGTIGDYTCFSFQAIKQITTGDGGMLTVKDERIYKRAKLLRWYGIDREFKSDTYWKYLIKEIGYKYSMNDIAAAMFIVQLDDLSKVLKRRKAIVERYRRELADVPGLTLLEDRPDRQSGNWLFTVRAKNRDAFQNKLNNHGIESSMVHIRCDISPIFGGKRQEDLPVMNEVETEYISIPLHCKLTDDDVNKIIKVIKSGW